MKTTAIILAGGRSTRMKYNKEYIKQGTSYLVHNTITILSSLFDEIIVVSNNEGHYKGYPVTVVQDILEGNSPIIGLHSGLTKSKSDYNYVIACDMPNVNPKYILFLKEILGNKEAYVTRQNSFIEPFNAFYHVSIIPQIEKHIKENSFGFQHLVKSLNTHYISEKDAEPFQEKGNMFLNINSESDLLDRTNKYAPLVKYFEITKYSENESYNKTDQVITEYPLQLHINGTPYSMIMMTPKDIEFMIYGYLHSNQIITSIDDVLSIDIDVKNKICKVSVNDFIEDTNHKVQILSSACTSNPKPVSEGLLPLVTKNNIFDLSNLLQVAASFNKQSILFKETGGVHSVSLNNDTDSILFEDIGRHNAVDKVCGYILKNNIKHKNNYIVTSGRISSDIVLKSALMNIELIVSRSAPTALAINLAKKLNITVAGFARGNKLNVYSHFKRIKKD